MRIRAFQILQKLFFVWCFLKRLVIADKAQVLSRYSASTQQGHYFAARSPPGDTLSKILLKAFKNDLTSGPAGTVIRKKVVFFRLFLGSVLACLGGRTCFFPFK